MKKLIQNLIFLEVFDSMHVFFPKTSLSGTSFLRKKENVNFDILTVKKDKKNIFESKLSRNVWCSETSFTWNSVGLLNFTFQTWCVVQRCFNIWHAVKLPLQKMTSCIKLTKNWLIFKILIRIWRFGNNLFQNQVLFHSYDRITVFFPFLDNGWLLSKRKAATLAFFGVKRSKSDCLKAEISSESVFLEINFTSKSNAL